MLCMHLYFETNMHVLFVCEICILIFKRAHEWQNINFKLIVYVMFKIKTYQLKFENLKFYLFIIFESILYYSLLFCIY